jgi:hypothetical protein
MSRFSLYRTRKEFGFCLVGAEIIALLVFGLAADGIDQVFSLLFYTSPFWPIILLVRFALAGFIYSNGGSSFPKKFATIFFWSWPVAWFVFQITLGIKDEGLNVRILAALSTYLACETGLFLLTRKLQIEKGTN